MPETYVHKIDARESAGIRRFTYWAAITMAAAVGFAIIFITTVDWWVDFISHKSERDFVRPYVGFFTDDRELSEDEQAIQNWLQGLADRAAAEQGLPEDAFITVHYIPSGLVNAFATLGGHVFVFGGLLEELTNENAIAMVIAHEVAHVNNRDVLESVGRGVMLQVLFSGLGDVQSSSDALSELSGEALLGVYSRDQERDADIDAAFSVVAVYGHAAGVTDLFDLLRPEEANPELYDEWLATHPGHSERYDYLQLLITENDWPVSEPAAYPAFVNISLEAAAPGGRNTGDEQP